MANRIKPEKLKEFLFESRIFSQRNLAKSMKISEVLLCKWLRGKNIGDKNCNKMLAFISNKLTEGRKKKTSVEYDMYFTRV